jgi:hypothetical protein
MEQSPSWESDSSSASQKIISNIVKPQSALHVHNSPPLVRILSHLIYSTSAILFI